MKPLYKTMLYGAIFVALIILIHMALAFFIDDAQILRALRPFRDALFFPIFVVIDNTSQIYCALGDFGITDYKRCLVPAGKMPIPDGPTKQFKDIMVVLSIIFGILYYAIIFRVIIYLKKKLIKE